MGKGAESSLLGHVIKRQSLARWRKTAQAAPKLPLSKLRMLRSDARKLRRELDAFLHVAEGRLQLPLIGADKVIKPTGCDWSWRPELWRGAVFPQGIAAAPNRTKFGKELTLFHDSAESEITLRQLRNRREDDLAPFGFRMDVFGFEGSFLSCALDLPDAALQGLQDNHILRLEMVIETERPLNMFCRLNIRHGPNTDQRVLELPHSQGRGVAEFDLAYTKMNAKRLEKIWIDIIFENPEMNRILLRDLTCVRYPRAEI